MSIFGGVVGRLVSAVQGVITPDSRDPPQQQPAPPGSPSWWQVVAAAALMGAGVLVACPSAREAVFSAVGGAASYLGQVPPFSTLKDYLAVNVCPHLREAFIASMSQLMASYHFFMHDHYPSLHYEILGRTAVQFIRDRVAEWAAK